MKRFLVRLWPLIHPLLFAVFPILFLYTHNMSETSASQIYVPILLSIAAALVLWVLLSLLLRSTLKAGLATTIFVIFFFSYGRLYDLLEKWDVFVPSHGHLLPAALLVWGYCVYFIKIARRDFRNTTKILNALAVVLILVNLFSIASYQIGKPSLPAGNSSQAQAGSTVVGNSTEIGTMPDIYYIILDEYAHPDTMLEYYDYDNSEFINYLVDRGFFVADGSRTRNYSTQRALCSYLNMEWLSEAETDSIVYQKIENNRVVSFLRTYDYKVVFFGNPFSTNRYKFDADVSYDFYTNGSSALVSEFPRILWNTTMFRPFYDYLTQNQFQSTLRRGLLDTLEHLKEMPHMEGPKFVFAHIDCPHEPFVFGPEGEDVSFMNYTNFEDKQFYLGQYIFISREIAKVVEVLLGESSDPPVIVIQSDHGIRAAIVPGNERWKIFNAYFMPADGGDMLYDTISPVNSFRVIFNQYFNADYPLLED